ncbi:MAG: DUF4416 family protein, partial [Planctomycetota bacterium]|nr:DUF4416 family protein [Planctomycetota bacterium]
MKFRFCLAAPRGRRIIWCMGQIREVEPVKLFVGMLSAYPVAFTDAEAALVDRLGPLDLRSDLFSHEFTEYYRDEMGHPLVRLFVSFERLVAPDQLPAIKRLTNEIENRMAGEKRWPVVRPINLDPGYIAPSKLVLASTKDFSHRIHLQEGIYAEVTLRYVRGIWKELEWTYPDYRTPAYHKFFTQVRGRLMEQR